MSNIDENEENYSGLNQSIVTSFVMGQQPNGLKSSQKAYTLLGQDNQNGGAGEQLARSTS